MPCIFNLGENVTNETLDDGVIDHHVADVTIVSYILQAANSGKHDTDAFIVLAY